MRLLFFACQQIGVDCIKYALEKGIEIPAVYTYELLMDKTYGYESVKDFCNSERIKCVANESACEKFVSKCNPDMIISAYYRKILPFRIFSIPEHGAVNIHPSLLPEYRGPVPTVWALLHGMRETGVTLHYIDKGVDTGDIILQKNVSINIEDTGYTLYKKCMNTGVILFKKMIDMLLEGKSLPCSPQHKGGSYYGSMEDSMRVVNWKNKGEFIVNQSRAFRQPYIGLEAKLLNKRVLIWKASVLKDPHVPVQKPGRIVGFDGSRILVTVADGVLSIDEYEMFPALNDIEREIYFRVGNFFS